MQTEEKERRKASLLDRFLSWVNPGGEVGTWPPPGALRQAMFSLLKRVDEQAPQAEPEAHGAGVEKQKRKLTGEEFAALLFWLDPDPTVAAEQYEQMRARLIRYFAQRRCRDAESLADETIDRVARNVHAGKETQGKREPYFMGVARHVAQEAFRQQQRHGTDSLEDLPPGQRAEIETHSAAPDDSARQAEQRDDCMRRCLDALGADESELLIIYYAGKDDSRQKLAEFLGIRIKALRHRVLRLRKRLRKCLTECLASFEA